MKSLELCEKYLVTIFGFILLACLIDIAVLVIFISPHEYIPKGVVRLIILLTWFYYLYKGYRWAKWLGIISCIFAGIWLLYAEIGILTFGGKTTYANIILTNDETTSIVIACSLLFAGTIYCLSALFILFSKNINMFLLQQRELIEVNTKRQQVANFFYVFGTIVAVCTVAWSFTVGLINTINNPKLVIGFLMYLPIKLPLYAIPGGFIVLIGRLIQKK